MSDLEDVLKALPQLSRQQLDEVIRHANATKSLTPDKITAGTDADLVVDAVIRTLQRKGLAAVNPVVLRNIKPNEELLTWAKQHTKTRVELIALLSLGFELLANNLTELHIPIGPKTLMRHASRVPGVVDRAFPGYAQSNLLGFILTHGRDRTPTNPPR